LPNAEALTPYLRQIDQNRQYTNFGPLHGLLEQHLARLLECEHVICVSSCTAGLELSLAALNLPPKSLIVVPSLTFPAVGSAVLRNGHVPVFCDVALATGLLDIDAVMQAMDKHDIAAAMPSCIFGSGYDVALWDDFTRATGVPVLLDAAGAIGFQAPGAVTSAVYSLHATKPLSAGEGGFLATSDGNLATQVRALSNFGFTKDGISRAGTNAKLSEYHCAVALAGLESWGTDKARRVDLLALYKAAFSECGVSDHADIMNASGVAGTLTIRCARAVTDKDMSALEAMGVETRRWYVPPLHCQPLYSGCTRVGPLETTEELAGRALGLPFHLDLDQSDTLAVARAIKSVLR
jgi:dTDP-4-amino-4,6-dideoxygalactose transaminase